MRSPQATDFEVRRIVDWQVTNRLLAVSGVTQVVVFGGDATVSGARCTREIKSFNVSLQDVSEAVAGSNQCSAAT